MKKIIYIVCLCLSSGLVFAEEAYWKFGTSGACIVQKFGSGDNDVFYYCEDQDKGCADVRHWSTDVAHWQKQGDMVEVDNKQWWCCDGKYIMATSLDEPITKEVVGGTCTYYKHIDGCGTVRTDPECSKPTDCADGYALDVSEKVVTGLAKADVNAVCIKCDTTLYSGIVGQYCLRCDKDTQFYDKMEKMCIDKKNMVKHSSERMAKCFMCKDNNKFKQCLNGKTVEKDCPID